MKKLVLTIAVVLGMTLGASAQYFANNDAQPNQGGGLFGRGMVSDEMFYGASGTNGLPLLPLHNQDGDQDAPLGSGALLLIGFGAAYAVAKKKRKE
ncbi:MAG: hypothetical protein MJZ94_08760 [Bacteroidales bacterium]|nr:hypothetical protein [Bacteroidales bacterium]